MSQFPWRPIPLAMDLEKQIENAFVELIHKPWGGLEPESWQPEVDVYEDDDEYLIEADLPGVKPEDFKINVEATSVTMSGARRSTRWTHTQQQVRVERRQGRFVRRISLAHSVDADKVEIRCEDGVYLVRLPKNTA